MITFVKALQLIARLLVVIQVVLGFLIWFGNASVTQTHILVGSLFVLTLWLLAIVALFALPKRMLPLLALLMGGAILWFGVAQQSLLVGSAHWAVRLLHLLLAVSAMGLVEPMAKAVIAGRRQ